MKHIFLCVIFSSTFIVCYGEVCTSGQFGVDCLLQCKCANTTAQPCHTQCNQCKRGYSSPPKCQRENVALAKPVYSSGNKSCEAVVDGMVGASTVTCTQIDSSGYGWLYVDLKFEYHLRWLRVSYGVGTNDLLVAISDKKPSAQKTGTRCITQGTVNDNAYDIDCGTGKFGRYVYLQRYGNFLDITELEVFYCAPHTFGKFCNRQCNCYYRTDVCDQVNGSCHRGCAAGFHGDGCSYICPNGKYGVDCAKNCFCAAGDVCDRVQGTCRSGMCDFRHLSNRKRCELTCDENKWGYPECQRHCHCGNNHFCDVTNGYCHDQQCENPRWTGSACDQTCGEGYFFIHSQCTGRCHCKNPKVCNVANGRCVTGGCEIGWMGAMCNIQCAYNRWGINCKKNCFCKNQQKCSPYGVCENGCRKSYFGVHCDITCEPLKFLTNQTCSGNCHCNKCSPYDGTCGDTCWPGWRGDRCQDPCPKGTYGHACAKTCHCLADECNNVDGICVRGCVARRKEPSCIDCEDGFFGHNCQFNCHCKNNALCSSANGACSEGCADGFAGTDCQSVIFKGFPETDINLIIIIASSAGCLVVLLLLILAFCFCCSRNKLSHIENFNKRRKLKANDFLSQRPVNNPNTPFSKRNAGENLKCDFNEAQMQIKYTDEYEQYVKTHKDGGPLKHNDLQQESLKKHVNYEKKERPTDLSTEDSDHSFDDKSHRHDHGDQWSYRSASTEPGHREFVSESFWSEDIQDTIDKLNATDKSFAKLTAKLPNLCKPIVNHNFIPQYRREDFCEPLEYGCWHIDDEMRQLFGNPNLVVTDADLDCVKIVNNNKRSASADNGGKKNDKHVSMGDVYRIPARVKSYYDKEELEQMEKRQKKRQEKLTNHNVEGKIAKPSLKHTSEDLKLRRSQENLTNEQTCSKTQSLKHFFSSLYQHKTDAKLKNDSNLKNTGSAGDQLKNDIMGQESEASLKTFRSGESNKDNKGSKLKSNKKKPDSPTNVQKGHSLEKPINRKESRDSVDFIDKDFSKRKSGLTTKTRDGKEFKWTRESLLTPPDKRHPDDPSLVKNWSSTSQNSFLAGWDD